MNQEGMNEYVLICMFLTPINIGILYAINWYVDKSAENSKKLLEALKEERSLNV